MDVFTKDDEVMYLIIDNSRPSIDRCVGYFTHLADAIDVVSKRHHFSNHRVWKNLGDELSFEDYTIDKLSINSFPCKRQMVSFELFPQERYEKEIIEEKRIRENILSRADDASRCIQSLEKHFRSRRGNSWTTTLSKDEMDKYISLEDESYSQVCYDQWGTSIKNPWY